MKPAKHDFNTDRLEIAREARGLTKRELAHMLEISERQYSKYIRGDSLVPDYTQEKLSKILQFPLSFFSGHSLDSLNVESISFRGASRMTSRLKNMVKSHSTIIKDVIIEWIDSEFNLPDIDIPDLQELRSSGGNFAESCADFVRYSWGLGEMPISNMIELLESKGILVFSLSLETQDVDACCFWHNSRPVILLNQNKTAERCRFDAAHELGHLIMHKHEVIGEKTDRKNEDLNIEKEANEFASAFLMPKSSIISICPKFVNMNTIIELKKYYGSSAKAMIYRLNSLELISEWINRELNRQLAVQGKSFEPEPINHEKSFILRSIFQSLKNDGVTRVGLVRNIWGLDPYEIDSWTFNLAGEFLDNEKEARIRRSGMHILENEMAD